MTLFYGTAGYAFGEKSPTHPRECGYGYGPTRQSRRASARAPKRGVLPHEALFAGPLVDRQMPPDRGGA